MFQQILDAKERLDDFAHQTSILKEILGAYK